MSRCYGKGDFAVVEATDFEVVAVGTVLVLVLILEVALDVATGTTGVTGVVDAAGVGVAKVKPPFGRISVCVGTIVVTT